MLYRKTALRLAAPVAVLALALTACSGGDDEADAKSPATSQAKASPSPSKASSGGELKAGESATGVYEEDQGKVTYEILAEQVDIGTEAEAAQAVADPEDAKGLVLAAARVKFTHKSGPALTGSPQVGDETTVWADGQRGSILIGAAEDAAGCEDPYDVESWKQGESHTFCETYLVPADAQNVEVHWEEAEGEPYIWTFPNS
ncbi:hypothetical protein [Streptomyces sp. P17]|uniref:hypothetical protein n=1 Tax=Streptomyces sp. P17 TaxID=3074716 RepID=UPI0028F42520|nr:hypothetical protein [Streptomyces sp. P17]MDT9699754.1 hypothetical protein [Streptomyces sp. P17]